MYSDRTVMELKQQQPKIVTNDQESPKGQQHPEVFCIHAVQLVDAAGVKRVQPSLELTCRRPRCRSLCCLISSVLLARWFCSLNLEWEMGTLGCGRRLWNHNGSNLVDIDHFSETIWASFYKQAPSIRQWWKIQTLWRNAEIFFIPGDKILFRIDYRW